jgi:3-oxoacyl-[acyl-carrier protein] reductase
MAMNTLLGKVALVTGGSRGIGAASCVALARAGCDVAINFSSHSNKAEGVAKEIRGFGRRVVVVQADVSNSGVVSRMVQEVSEELGAISVLVNNAAISRPQKIEDISEADWDELINTNLKSAFLVSQAVLPAMRAQRWGRIINMSSVAAQTGGLVGPHYAASKAGMLGLTHSYAGLLVKEGITVNAIAPALIATEMVMANARAMPEVIPVGRFGTVEEVAGAVVMLAENGYITGQTININGGWYFS